MRQELAYSGSTREGSCPCHVPCVTVETRWPVATMPANATLQSGWGTTPLELVYRFLRNSHLFAHDRATDSEMCIQHRACSLGVHRRVLEIVKYIALW